MASPSAPRPAALAAAAGGLDAPTRGTARSRGPLAADGEEGDDAPGAQPPRSTASSTLACSSPLRCRALARHPEDHPGDEADGDDRQEPADGLLRLERQRPGAEGQGRAERQRQRDRGGHPEPDPADQVPALGLDQVGDEDADDQRASRPSRRPIRKLPNTSVLSGKANLMRRGYMSVRTAPNPGAHSSPTRARPRGGCSPRVWPVSPCRGLHRAVTRRSRCPIGLRVGLQPVIRRRKCPPAGGSRPLLAPGLPVVVGCVRLAF